MYYLQLSKIRYFFFIHTKQFFSKTIILVVLNLTISLKVNGNFYPDNCSKHWATTKGYQSATAFDT